MTNFSDISADPLYLTALASLGPNVPARFAAAPTTCSIAVLPFVNSSGDPTQETFTDGLTEDIITDLSKVSGFFVIARNSSFSYKGKPTDVRRVAHDLGVKYILEGSARKAGQRLRINVQLVAAGEGGNHIWAERFDRELADVFDVQDEITRLVVEAIVGKINAPVSVEHYRPTNIEAYDLCVQSRNQWSVSKPANDEAIICLRRAIAMDANYCEAHWRLANSLFCSWFQWDGPQQPQRRDSVSHALRAVEINPADLDAHSALGSIMLYERRWDEAEAQFKEALWLNPNNAAAHMSVAEFQVCSGRPKEGLEAGIRALRLNPKPPGTEFWMFGILQIVNGQYGDAIATLRREETYGSNSRRMLAAALAMAGRIEEAQEEAKLFLTTNPQWRFGAWIEILPLRHQKEANFWATAFRLAGLPE